MTYVSQRVRAMPRSGIREVMDLTAGQPDVIHLEVGQPDFRTPTHIVEAAVRAAEGGAHGYTPNRGIDPLREAVAERLRADHDVLAHPDGTVVTCGAVNALYAALTVLLDPGDAMLVPDPGWPNFAMMADLIGARAVRYPLDPSCGHRPDLDRLERLAASTDRLRVLLVNSPNNPTGGVLDEKDVVSLVDIAERHGLTVVSDECYGRIVFDGIEHVSPARFAPDRVVLVTSVSKTYAMTGWRVGFLVAPRDVADAAAKVQEPVVACATTVSQYAAVAALTGDQSPVDAMVGAYRASARRRARDPRSRRSRARGATRSVLRDGGCLGNRVRRRRGGAASGHRVGRGGCAGADLRTRCGVQRAAVAGRQRVRCPRRGDANRPCHPRMEQGMTSSTIDRLVQGRVVPIVRLERMTAAHAVEIAEALVRSGLRVVEFTMNTPGALAAVAAVADALADQCLVGAGTVLDAEAARAAIDAGAQFVVSPNTDPEVIAVTRERGAVSVPGAFTATEIRAARRAGADLVKLFPSGPVGPSYLAAMLGPYDDARIVPTGGIQIEDIPAFLAAGAVAVGVGSPLIGRGDPDEIETRAHRALELAGVNVDS